MARPLRIEYEGAWYHVMNRGINKQVIYKTNTHRETFLSLLNELAKKYFIEIHAYCLMDNHYHVLCRTPLANLGKAMRHLDGLYTRRFNISEHRDGSIFRGRYKAILIEKENYLLKVSRYIHLNPVTAKICKNPADYKWSSYQFFVNNNVSLDWLVKTEILQYFNCYNEYRDFVLEGVDENTVSFYNYTFSKTIIGSDEFVNNMLKNVNEKQKAFCNPDIKRLKNLPSLEKIVETVSTYFMINPNQLQASKQGKLNIPRMIAIFLSRQYAQLGYKKISDFYKQISTDSVGLAIKRFEKRAATDVKISKCLKEIYLHLKEHDL